MAKGKRFESGSNKERKKIKLKAKVFRAILIIVLLISVMILALKFGNKKDDFLIKSIIDDNSKPQENIETERMRKLKELQKQNSDIIAWIEIENSKIDYPVLQGKDNSFYMTHDYKKEYSIDGSLFLDKDYNWSIPSSNLLIYGHNNRGSIEMFVDLMKYKEEDYYNNHKTIRFTTAEEDAEYEIIAVFLSRVYYKSEKNVFRYYYFINAENEQEFNDYVENSKKASLYNIDATAQYGDQLLTLSTCSYHTEDRKTGGCCKKNEITILGTVLNRKFKCIANGVGAGLAQPDKLLTNIDIYIIR